MYEIHVKDSVVAPQWLGIVPPLSLERTNAAHCIHGGTSSRRAIRNGLCGGRCSGLISGRNAMDHTRRIGVVGHPTAQMQCARAVA